MEKEMSSQVRWRVRQCFVLSAVLAMFLHNASFTQGAPQIPLSPTRSELPHQTGFQYTETKPSSRFHVFRDIDDNEFESQEVFGRSQGFSSSSFFANKNLAQKKVLPVGKPLSKAGGTSSVRITKKKISKFHGDKLKSNGYTILPASLEDIDNDDDLYERDNASFENDDNPRHHVTKSSHGMQKSGYFRYSKHDDDDDDVSFEDIIESVKAMSLGRRFHPQGVPKRSDVVHVKPDLLSSPKNLNINPFIVSPNVAKSRMDSFDFDDDMDDDDDDFVVLSPLVKIYNHESDDEKLSLSHDFMSQYNFVDNQGITKWGYKTDDQYQDHKLHSDGAMEGTFGWSYPEGSQVNIQYIADENGYRVISSSGIYLQDTEEVRVLKDRHLSEHEKTIKYHNDLRQSMGSNSGLINTNNNYNNINNPTFTNENIGIPLRPLVNPSLNPQVPLTNDPLNPNTFGILPNDDELLINIPTRPGGSQNTGIPLPTPEVTGGNSNQNSGTSGTKSDSNMFMVIPDDDMFTELGPVVPPVQTTHTGAGTGIHLPPLNIGNVNIDSGVSLTDNTPFTGETSEIQGINFPTLNNIPPSIDNTGIPLPDPSITPQLQTTRPGGSQNTGIPLPTPEVAGGNSNQNSGTSGTNSDSNMFMVIPGDNMFTELGPVVPPVQKTHTGAGTGIHLPPLNIGNVNIDSGVSLTDNTPFTGETSEIQGINIPTFNNIPPSIDNTGIPLPDPSITPQVQTEKSFGIPTDNLDGSIPIDTLQPTIPLEGGLKTISGSSNQPLPVETGFGIHLPGSSLAVNVPSTDLSGSSQPETAPNVIESDTNFETFGIPLPGSIAHSSQNIPSGSDLPLVSNGEAISSGTPAIHIDGEAKSISVVSPSKNINDVALENSPVGLTKDDTLTKGISVSDTLVTSGSPKVPQDKPITSFGIPLLINTNQVGSVQQPNPTISQNKFTILPDDEFFLVNTGSNANIGLGLPFGAQNNNNNDANASTLTTHNTGIDPCLNGKLHPSLLPARCFEGLNKFIQEETGPQVNDANIVAAVDAPTSEINDKLNTIGISLFPLNPSLATTSDAKVDSSSVVQASETNPAESDLANNVFTNEESVDFDPCLNSKLHPSLLPAHCLEKQNPDLNAVNSKSIVENSSKTANLPTSVGTGNSATFGIPLPPINLNIPTAIETQTNQREGKSLRRSTHTQNNENENSFIVVVDTDLFH